MTTDSNQTTGIIEALWNTLRTSNIWEQKSALIIDTMRAHLAEIFSEYWDNHLLGGKTWQEHFRENLPPSMSEL